MTHTTHSLTLSISFWYGWWRENEIVVCAKTHLPSECQLCVCPCQRHIFSLCFFFCQKITLNYIELRCNVCHILFEGWTHNGIFHFIVVVVANNRNGFRLCKMKRRCETYNPSKKGQAFRVAHLKKNKKKEVSMTAIVSSMESYYFSYFIFLQRSWLFFFYFFFFFLC